MSDQATGSPRRGGVTREREFCGYPDCDRPLWRLGLCQTHGKQRQRGKPLRPIPERLTPGEAALVAAFELAEANSEDDKEYERLRAAFLRAARAWLRSEGWRPQESDEGQGA